MGKLKMVGPREVFELKIDSFKVRQQLTRELYAKWGFSKL